MNNRERIGLLLAEARKAAGLTVRQLGEQTGLDPSNISKIENGKYNVSIDILDKIVCTLERKIEFTDNKTSLKRFVLNNKERNDIIGDLCSDLLRDNEFKRLHIEEKQRQHIIMIGYSHSHVQDAICEFFREYSGEVIEFEDGLYIENEEVVE